jgi:anti-sigma factor RsiW
MSSEKDHERGAAHAGRPLRRRRLDDASGRFEAHLAGCAACQQEVAEFRSTTGRLSQLMAERPPETLRAAIMARVATTPQESAPPRPDPGDG